MNKYLVGCKDKEIYLFAESCTLLANGLYFKKGDDIIGVFVNWDFWCIVDEE